MTMEHSDSEDDQDLNSESSGNHSSSRESESSESEKEESLDEDSFNEDAESIHSNSEPSKNLAWVDSISKILKTKSKTAKPIVLSKAKKLTEVKPKPKPAGFEIELSDGKIKEEVIEEPAPEKQHTSKPKRKKKRELPDVRVKPSALEKDRERVLSKIATRGVVQLFNAVRSQQKDIKEKLKEAGPLEVKTTKVLKSLDKNTFLDALMSEKSQNVDQELEKYNHTEIKKEDKNEKVWDVLRDNFMMDAKMKDWDKEIEQEIEMEVE